MNTAPANSQINTRIPKVRVALFGSFYRGYYVLHELLNGDVCRDIEVVGVATDDANQAYVSPSKRVWQYPHVLAERSMVETLARSYRLDVYTGRVKTAEFYERMSQHWKPDLCIMATFGQKISPELFNAPPLGFYNLHPCIDDSWPSTYVGGNPFQALLDNHQPYTVIAMHRVDEGFDTGELIAYSERIAIPPHVSVVDLHKITSTVAGKLAAAEIKKIIVRERTKICP
jgi:methionyl-tRNA formyltransferase